MDDAILGRIEFPNVEIEDLVLVRSDGRPTYNFASPLEDMWDGITHVIRGADHISNTPKQIQILQALGGEIPVYAHVPNVNGADGKKLSKRHGAVTVDEFRRPAMCPRRSWTSSRCSAGLRTARPRSCRRDELVERFSLERVGASPATFDYDKLDWMNGVYLRELPQAEYADRLVAFLREQGSTGTRSASVRPPRSCKRRSRLSASSPSSPASSSTTSSRIRRSLTATCWQRRPRRLSAVEPFEAEQIEIALKELCERLGLKPRQAFQPIRVAVTGSKVSPGLYESLELLGEGRVACATQPRCRCRCGLGGASGSRARWNSRHARRR